MNLSYNITNTIFEHKLLMTYLWPKLIKNWVFKKHSQHQMLNSNRDWLAAPKPKTPMCPSILTYKMLNSLHLLLVQTFHRLTVKIWWSCMQGYQKSCQVMHVAAILVGDELYNRKSRLKMKEKALEITLMRSELMI